MSPSELIAIWTLIAAPFAVVVVLGAISVLIIPVRVFMEAWAADVPIGMWRLVRMRLRRVPPEAVIRPLIRASKAAVPLQLHDLEEHYLAGGNLDRIVTALVRADKSGLDMQFKEAAAIDLAGRDVADETAQRIAVISGGPDEMACPACGELIKIDRTVLSSWVRHIRDDPGLRRLYEPKR